MNVKRETLEDTIEIMSNLYGESVTGTYQDKAFIGAVFHAEKGIVTKDEALQSEIEPGPRAVVHINLYSDITIMGEPISKIYIYSEEVFKGKNGVVLILDK